MLEPHLLPARELGWAAEPGLSPHQASAVGPRCNSHLPCVQPVVPQIKAVLDLPQPPVSSILSTPASSSSLR